MGNFEEQSISLQRGTGTSGSEVYSNVNTINIPEISLAATPAVDSYSDEIWLRIAFPSDFSGIPQNSKVWKSSGKLQEGYSLLCGFNDEYDTPESASVSSYAVGDIISKLAAAYESSYVGPSYDSSDKYIGHVVLQVKADNGSESFDSGEKKRPLVLTFAFDRGDVPVLDKEYTNGLLSDLATLSSWDLYYLDQDGSEQILGYMDNTFGITETMDTAELLNGLPEAVLHSSVIKVGAEITGQLQIFDPVIQNMVGHYDSTDEGQVLRLSQKNSFRTLDEFHFILRGFNVAGHLMEFHIPRGQIYRDGDMSLGGSDYTRYGVRIKSLAQENTGITHYWEISQVPVQTLRLVLNYSGS